VRVATARTAIPVKARNALRTPCPLGSFFFSSQKVNFADRLVQIISRVVSFQMGALDKGKCACWVASLMLLGSGIAYVWFWSKEYPRIDGDSYKSLDVQELKKLWQWRREKYPIICAINGVYTMGMLLIIPVAVALKRLFKDEYTFWKTKKMKGAFMIGSIFPFAIFLGSVGAYCMSFKITSWDKLPDSAFQTIELEFLLSFGRHSWFWLMHYLCMSVGFAWAAKFTFCDEKKKLPRGHGVLSAFLALTGMAVLAVATLTFVDYMKFIGIYMIATFAWSSVLIPIWLTTLGFHLAQHKQFEYQQVFSEIPAPPSPLAPRRSTPAAA